MTEQDLMEQLLSISLESSSSKDDNRMMNIGFLEARNKSVTIIKEYLAKNRLLEDEVGFDLIDDELLDLEEDLKIVSVKNGQVTFIRYV